eukprot:COSAG02_NODE_1835_length_10714_cov_7.585437_8_plen_110_part_00
MTDLGQTLEGHCVTPCGPGSFQGHRLSQSASHLTYHTPIAYITYHSTTSLLSHIMHHASHHTSCMGASRCLSSPTQCHPLYNFIVKISIENPDCAPLCTAECAELPGKP